MLRFFMQIANSASDVTCIRVECRLFSQAWGLLLWSRNPFSLVPFCFLPFFPLSPPFWVYTYLVSSLLQNPLCWNMDCWLCSSIVDDIRDLLSPSLPPPSPTLSFLPSFLLPPSSLSSISLPALPQHSFLFFFLLSSHSSIAINFYCQIMFKSMVSFLLCLINQLLIRQCLE